MNHRGTEDTGGVGTERRHRESDDSCEWDGGTEEGDRQTYRIENLCVLCASVVILRVKSAGAQAKKRVE